MSLVGLPTGMFTLCFDARKNSEIKVETCSGQHLPASRTARRANVSLADMIDSDPPLFREEKPPPVVEPSIAYYFNQNC